jgi:iron(III) transport system permease protein
VTLAASAILLAAIGLLPLLAMVAGSFHLDEGFSLRSWHALFASATQQALSMGRSILLSLVTSAAATFLGVPLGFLIARSDLPLRRAFAAAFTVPLLIPPYLLAVAWFAILGKGGWLGHALRPAMSDRVSSAFFGLLGCAGVLVSAFMAVVMLLTVSYLGAVNPRLEDAGRLVSRWPSILFRITLPSIAPGIGFAAVLVFLLAFGEVGVPTFLRYPVYPMEILTQFVGFYDFGAATAAAVPMLLVTLAILSVEYRLLRHPIVALRTVTVGAKRAPLALGRWRLPVFGIVSTGALVIVVMPWAALLVQSGSSAAYIEAFARASDSIARSVGLAAIGATSLTALGFFCGYLVHNRAVPLWRGIDALALFLFTLPGAVIGVGLISLWNRPALAAVYGSAAIIILGYLAQYTVIPMRIMSGFLQQVPPSLEQAGWVSGASWFMSLRRILLPLIWRGMIVAWLVGYVFCLRDTGISMVLYPPGSDTLPVRILTLMANGAPSLIAALCVILVVVTLVPLGAAGLWLRHGMPRP